MLAEITTIIPTRNRSEFLKKCIFSILGQSENFKNKIIVCDNASDDNTSELLKKLQSEYSNIEYYKHDKNIGLYQNFSFGISKVKTKYFNLISDDDQLTKNYLKECLKIFEENRKVDIVIGDTLVVNKNKYVLAGPFRKFSNGFMNNKEATIKMSQNLIPRTWTGMVFKKNINYDYKINPQYGPMADGLWLIDLISKHNVYCFNKIGGILFAHENSTSQQIKIIDKNQIDGFNLFKKNFESNTCFNHNEKKIIYQGLKPDVDNIISKQFISCILKNDKNGIAKILFFLKEYNFNNLFLKYSSLNNLFKILFFLIPLCRIINLIRKKYQNFFHFQRSKKFKFILKDLL